MKKITSKTHLDDVYHFTSSHLQTQEAPFLRRYTAAGKVINGFMVIAFAIASEVDEFRKDKGLAIAEGRLAKHIAGHYNEVYSEVLPEGVNPEKAGAFFNEIVHRVTPLACYYHVEQAIAKVGSRFFRGVSDVRGFKIAEQLTINEAARVEDTDTLVLTPTERERLDELIDDVAEIWLSLEEAEQE